MPLSLLILAGMMIASGVLLVGVVLLLMALMLLRPPRMTDGKSAYLLKRLSPGDLGLPFENMRFEVRDARTGALLPIAAWWIGQPSAAGKCVMLIHGYSDAKVGAIAWAPLWHSLGYNILAIDLRAHGESGGRYSTAGFFERHDVDQVLNDLIASRPQATSEIVLFGVSLGAAVALGVAQMRDDIRALVLESPYASYRNAIDAHAHVMQTPLPGLAPLAVRLAEWISGAHFDAVRPIDLMTQVKIPMMAIHASDDPFVSSQDAADIERVMRERSARGEVSMYWLVEGVTHVMAIAADPHQYRQKLVEFLQSAAAPAADTARCR